MTSIEADLNELHRKIEIGCAPMQKVIEIVKSKDGVERTRIVFVPDAIAWKLYDDNDNPDFVKAEKIREKAKDVMVNSFQLLMKDVLVAKQKMKQFHKETTTKENPIKTDEKLSWGRQAAIWRDLMSEETIIKTFLTQDESGDTVAMRQLAEKKEDYSKEVQEELEE